MLIILSEVTPVEFSVHTVTYWQMRCFDIGVEVEASTHLASGYVITADHSEGRMDGDMI